MSELLPFFFLNLWSNPWLCWTFPNMYFRSSWFCLLIFDEEISYLFSLGTRKNSRLEKHRALWEKKACVRKVRSVTLWKSTHYLSSVNEKLKGRFAASSTWTWTTTWCPALARGSSTSQTELFPISYRIPSEWNRKKSLQDDFRKMPKYQKRINHLLGFDYVI